MEYVPVLPDSLVLEIFMLLPHDAVLRAGLTCRQWLAVSRDEFLWKELFYSYYRIPRSVPRHPCKSPEMYSLNLQFMDGHHLCVVLTDCFVFVMSASVSWYGEFRRLFDCIPCVEVQTLREHCDQVLHLAFSHRGHRFSSCSKDCTVKVGVPPTSYLLTLFVLSAHNQLRSDCKEFRCYFNFILSLNRGFASGLRRL